MQPRSRKSLKLKTPQGSKLGRVTELDAEMELMEAIVQWASTERGKSSVHIDTNIAHLLAKSRLQKQGGSQCAQLGTQMKQPPLPLPTRGGKANIFTGIVLKYRTYIMFTSVCRYRSLPG